jgi:hypothetical protein
MGLNINTDYRIPQPTATNQILVWNDLTGLLEASASLSGLTLNSPVIAGDFQWAGFSILDATDGCKTIDLRQDTTGALTIRADNNNYIDINTGSLEEHIIEFGNYQHDVKYRFLGFGLTTFGGNIRVNNGVIGDMFDPSIIIMDGSNGLVTVDADLTATG